MEKKAIGYDYCYKNNYNSKLFARARVNALQLEEHKGRGNPQFDTTCKLCREEEEDLMHFIIKCKKLEAKRDYKVLNKKTRNPENRLRELLFKNHDYQAVSRVIRELWEHRKILLKQIDSK